MPDCFASMSPPSLSTTTYTPITPPSSTPSPPPSPASILSPSSFNPTLPTPQPRPQPPPAFPPLSIIKILSSWIATRTSFFDPVASPRPRAALLPASPTVGRVGPRVSIPADGSCMYWAVAAAWLGLPEGANISPLRGVTAYRRSLANHGAAETREARGALFDSFDSEAGFEAYLVEAASWRTYRGAFELDTLCRELGFQVLVLHRGGTLFEMWQRKKIGKEGPRFVLRLDWGHYCLDPDAAGFGGWTSQIPRRGAEGRGAVAGCGEEDRYHDGSGGGDGEATSGGGGGRGEGGSEGEGDAALCRQGPPTTWRLRRMWMGIQRNSYKGWRAFSSAAVRRERRRWQREFVTGKLSYCMVLVLWIFIWLSLEERKDDVRVGHRGRGGCAATENLASQNFGLSPSPSFPPLATLKPCRPKLPV